MNNKHAGDIGRVRFIAAATSLLPLIAAAQVPVYQIKDLGTLGGKFAQGVDINDAGQITGTSRTAIGAQHAFIYADGKMIDLGTLGGMNSDGAAINQAGQVAGSSETADGFTHAYRYANGLMTDLGTISGTYSVGNAISNTGIIAGLSTVADGEYHATSHSDAAGLQDLGTLGDSYSRGDAINDAGEVAGIYQNQFESHAFVYSGGVMQDLVPGMSSYIDPLGRSINMAGHVVGSYSASGVQHAFLYSDGAALDLGTLGGDSGGAVAINIHDQATGGAATASGEGHAFLYSSGTLADLGTLGGTYSMGYAINDAGVVVGTSHTADGYPHPFAYRNGQMIDLRLSGTPEVQGYQIDVASAINSAGQITGWYNLPGDESDPVVTRAFVATPISLLLSQLVDKSRQLPYGVFLGATLRLTQRSYAAENLQSTCTGVASFTYEIKLYRYVRAIDANTATAITADSTAIAEALGCPGTTKPSVASDQAAGKTAVSLTTQPRSIANAAVARTDDAATTNVCAASTGQFAIGFCRATPPLSRHGAVSQAPSAFGPVKH